MMLPIADGDPDPTTQIPWPTGRVRQRPIQTPPNNERVQPSPAQGGARSKAVEPTKRMLSTWDLFTLSVSMAGAQIAWTVELGCVVMSFKFPVMKFTCI